MDHNLNDQESEPPDFDLYSSNRGCGDLFLCRYGLSRNRYWWLWERNCCQLAESLDHIKMAGLIRSIKLPLLSGLTGCKRYPSSTLKIIRTCCKSVTSVWQMKGARIWSLLWLLCFYLCLLRRSWSVKSWSRQSGDGGIWVWPIARSGITDFVDGANSSGEGSRSFVRLPRCYALGCDWRSASFQTNSGELDRPCH